MGLKTFRALILPGIETFVETSSALSVEEIPENAFGFYFFDADPAQMEEDPKTAVRSNISGKTYVGMVHKVTDVIWDISSTEMERAVKGADTDKCVACPYGDSVMLLPFFEGKDTNVHPLPTESVG
jgi:hypothetical protein